MTLTIIYKHEINLIKNWRVWGHYSATASLQMTPWCVENCKGGFLQVNFTYTWLFEELEDAVAFKLRWDGYTY